MVEEEFRFEHRPGWQMSVLWLVVFCESVRREEGERDEKEGSGHAPELAAPTRLNVH